MSYIYQNLTHEEFFKFVDTNRDDFVLQISTWY